MLTAFITNVLFARSRIYSSALSACVSRIARSVFAAANAANASPLMSRISIKAGNARDVYADISTPAIGVSNILTNIIDAEARPIGDSEPCSLIPLMISNKGIS